MATPTGRTRTYLRKPGADEVKELGLLDHIPLDDADAATYADLLGEMVDLVDRLDELPLPAASAAAETARDAGYVPSAEEDPHNIYTRRCRVEGAESGPLKGLTFAAKDNLDVAGIPTTNASRMFPYTPVRDALTVERALAAGATLVGKTNLDDFAAGGTTETSYFGPTRNPRNPAYSPGGSSGGSGAAVAAGDVDFALAVDQGGSGRIPAAFCGVVAIKATHGLVPSHGSTHMDHTIDYVCPVAGTVELTARVLEAIAGGDERDPQWTRGDMSGGAYGSVEPRALEGLRVGVVPESCNESVCDADVLKQFADTVELLRSSGAKVEDLSVPLWPHGWDIELPMLISWNANMIRSEGIGYGHTGEVDPQKVHAFALARRREAHMFPPLVKVYLMAERFLHEELLNTAYAQAQCLRRELRAQIDAALSRCDVLITPGNATTAPELAKERMTASELIHRIPSVVYTTSPLNLSGHPALVLPNGTARSGLPTSVQVIGPHRTEELVLGAGLSLETALGS
jgi:amidase